MRNALGVVVLVVVYGTFTAAVAYLAKHMAAVLQQIYGYFHSVLN